MPAEKAASTFQRRLWVLEAIQRLSCTGRWVTQPEILKDLQSQGYDVVKSQVLRDLKALTETYAQLECNDNSRHGEPQRGVAYGYRWAGKDILRDTGLSVPAALSLVMVERYLRQALPVTLTQALVRWFEAARNTLDVQKRSAAARWTDKICVVPPTQPLLAPRLADDVLNAVHEAVLGEEQIDVIYHAVGEAPKHLVLHPLGLIQRGPATYLVAMTFDYDDVLLYALHRIERAERLHTPSRKCQGFVLRDYAEAQGHFGSGRALTLKARVSPHLAVILEETPLHANQTLSVPDEAGWYRLTARVRDTWELHWWLLSQGDRIEVVGPKRLRQAVIESLNDAMRLYGMSGSGTG